MHTGKKRRTRTPPREHGWVWRTQLRPSAALRVISSRAFWSRMWKRSNEMDGEERNRGGGNSLCIEQRSHCSFYTLLPVGPCNKEATIFSWLGPKVNRRTQTSLAPIVCSGGLLLELEGPRTDLRWMNPRFAERGTRECSDWSEAPMISFWGIR